MTLRISTILILSLFSMAYTNNGLGASAKQPALANICETAALDLTENELLRFFTGIFQLKEHESKITILTDLPATQESMDNDWADRIRILNEWTPKLRRIFPTRQISVLAYVQTPKSGAPLPDQGFIIPEGSLIPLSIAACVSFAKVEINEILKHSHAAFAANKNSATGPLYRALDIPLRPYPLKAISIPGFGRSLFPLFRLDYSESNHRLQAMNRALEGVDWITVEFEVETPADGSSKRYSLKLDTHGKKWLQEPEITDQGGVDNVPTGELFIIPVDGKGDTPSLSQGFLPVQIDGEVVVFRIENNFAVEVISQGPISARERQRLSEDPALGNIAEFGLGVLSMFEGAFLFPPEHEASRLVNEKFDLHIAFGLNDYFSGGGGNIGEKAFLNPQNTSHIDHIYTPLMQSHIRVRSADAHWRTGRQINIKSNDSYNSALFR